ncbi:MAG: hypothetical protein ACJA0C_000079 [Candidatus Endobugula sp.]|jgi:hypothetical protein
MGILNKLTTLSRGVARESADRLFDANAIRIFEQEIIDIENMIHLRKHSMSEQLVVRKQVDREIESIQALIKKREFQACELLNKDSQPALIEEIAVDIIQHETMLSDLTNQSEDLSKRTFKTEVILRKALTEVAQYRRDLRLAKAKQTNSCMLIKNVSNLSKQLSELKSTHQHVISLRVQTDDSESVWEEMENQITTNSINQRVNENNQEKNKKAILARIKKRAIE